MIYVTIKAIDKCVLGGAEAPPKFWHFCVEGIAHSSQHTTAYVRVAKLEVSIAINLVFNG